MPTYVANQQFAASEQDTLPNQSAGTQERPVTARLATGGFVTAWISSGALITQMFDADGREVGAEYVISAGGSAYLAAIVGLPGGGYAIAFSTAQDGVQVQAFNASGNASGPAFRANAGEFGGQQPSIAALPNGDLVVAWNASSSTTILEARIFQPSGVAVTDVFVIATGRSMSTNSPEVTALADGKFVATWVGEPTQIQQRTVYAQLYDASGRVVGPEQHIEAPPTGPYASNFFQSVAALADGGFVMSWTHETFETNSIQFQLFSAAGTPIGSVRQIESALGAGQSTVAALDNGGFVVNWQAATVDGGPNYFQQGDIHARVFDASGAAVGAEFVANSVTAAGQSLPVVTGFGTNDFAIVWETFSSSGDSNVAVRQFYSTTVGTAGGDTFNGTAGRDFIIGAAGADILSGGIGDDSLEGGIGDDTLSGGTGIDKLYGGGGDDIMFGGVGNDYIEGGDGADQIAGDAGDDILIGDGGIDSVSYASATTGVTVNLLLTDAQDTIGAGRDRLSDLEILIGSNHADRLTGGVGDNVIRGGDGNDRLMAFSGVDSLYGEAGDDTYIVGSDTLVVEAGNQGIDLIEAWDTDFTLPENVENLSLNFDPYAGAAVEPHPATLNGTGNSLNNVITGSYGANQLGGSTGADTIYGGGGDDVLSADRFNGFDNGRDIDILFGETGNDMIFAGYGDIVDGGVGFDTVGLSYLGASHGIDGDTRILHTGQPLVAGAGTFASIERFSDIALTQFNDKMVIGDQSDPAVVRSWDGDDHLIGQDMSITMYGGSGNDLLVGGRADDVIYGENGNDRLLGFLGADELWGGAGADTFYFAIDGATDRVRDFERGIDKLDVTGADADVSVAGDQAFTFIGSTAFSGKAGELRVYSANEEYFVAGDVNGDGVADLLINLGSVQVGSGDFYL